MQKVVDQAGYFYQCVSDNSDDYTTKTLYISNNTTTTGGDKQ